MRQNGAMPGKGKLRGAPEQAPVMAQPLRSLVGRCLDFKTGATYRSQSLHVVSGKRVKEVDALHAEMDGFIHMPYI